MKSDALHLEDRKKIDADYALASTTLASVMGRAARDHGVRNYHVVSQDRVQMEGRVTPCLAARKQVEAEMGDRVRWSEVERYWPGEGLVLTLTAWLEG